MRIFAFLFISVLLLSCARETEFINRVASPDGKLEVEVLLTDEGAPRYMATYEGKTIIDTSALGFLFEETGPLLDQLDVIGSTTDEVQDTWVPDWGENLEIENHYQSLKLSLEERVAPNRKYDLHIKVYNDGFGFRYEFSEQEGMDTVTILDELTQFQLTGDHTAWWIPGDHDSYEYLYSETRLSEVDARDYEYELDRPDRTIPDPHAVNTPVTMRTDSGLYLSFHEANLTDYAGMTLAIKEGNLLESALVPWADGSKVKTHVPFVTPWRTVQIASTPGKLIESNLMVNLNEPRILEDVSWIEPMKYTGIWWEMHLGKSSWAMREAEGSWAQKGVALHGATTENARDYIDFTSEVGVRGFLVEGWNEGWEYWGEDTLGFFNFVQPYPDFDLPAVVEYAEERNVTVDSSFGVFVTRAVEFASFSWEQVYASLKTDLVDQTLQRQELSNPERP
ncbi:MAG: glycoside hydrolase family 97 N-terminal domain-containing protein, partial [Saprospiraceae bacterium]|nr:glycoside hydrolase family 97 N-terminal domain-containing protein [Saprospiraceae bacterium]